jgi:hypothetical protein
MLLRRCAFASLVTFGVLASPAANGVRFYDDDPIARDPERQDASGAKPYDTELFFEYAYNLFVNSRHQPSNTHAGNVNTIDEVPDSSWFTNRVGAKAISTADLARGPNVGAPPSNERWTIIREKSAGTNPGFTARDAKGDTWFLAFDYPERPEGSSSAVEIATKIFWALGYNQIETFITSFDPNSADIDTEATIRRPSGARTPATRADIEEILERAARNADGTYRVTAGRLISGKVLGPFRYSGTRPDDPNDLVSHEHRRELRALRVFGAWTNLVDWKAGNTLDALVPANGEDKRLIVKHYLQDVGSTFGMANDPHVWNMGWEHFYEDAPTKRRLLTFGFGLSPWQTVPYDFYSSVGYFEGDEFDPTTWKPQTPTVAYMEMRADDAFWAARRVAAFTDEMIRAVVHNGQLSDPAAEEHLAKVLMKRRDKVARAYLPAINPIVNPALAVDGTLTFENAAVSAHVADPPERYRAVWSRFDNATGDRQPIGETQASSTTIPCPSGLPANVGSFVAVDLSADTAAQPSWGKPVRAYFRRTDSGWNLTGLDRLDLPKQP